MGELCKVLIVDDEMLIRQGIINYIDWKQAGFQIVGEASNGKEALQMIEALSPNIVITDIVMPIMDGIDLVQEAKNTFPEIEIIVLSSFENFDYVRSTFQNGVADYILKPQLNGPELLRILNNVVSRIPSLQNAPVKEKQVRSTEEILESMLLGYDLALEETNFSDVFTYEQFALVSVHGKNINLSTVEEAIKRSALDKITIFSFASSELETNFLLNFNPQQLGHMKEAIEQQATRTPNTTWMLHPPFELLNDLKKIVDEGRLTMHKYLFYLPDRPFFSYDSLPKENEKQLSFDLNQFIEMFKSRLFRAAISYLENHVNDLAGRFNNDSFEFKSFLGNIVFNIIVLLDTMKYETKELEEKKYSYFSNINEASHINEALSCFDEFMEKVEAIILSEDKANDQSKNLDKILTYIEQHYTEPLRLSEIASHFHFNASYLSSYFSAHHKEGFSEYLNRVRIKKAMKLLENSTVSISNISGMVGYSEHSYFCKVFKRITGMSPGNYRKELHARYENEEKGLSHLKK